jgi:hypothetical protein
MHGGLLVSVITSKMHLIHKVLVHSDARTASAPDFYRLGPFTLAHL